MFFRTFLIGLVTACALAGSASATTLVGPLNDPHGIQGLDIDGTTYDVSITADTIYSVAYSSSPPYFFGQEPAAIDAATAMVTFLNSIGATLGQSDRFIAIPYANVAGGGFLSTSAYYLGSSWALGFNTATAFYTTRFANFVPAAAPVPTTLPLLVTALGGLGFVGWRRRKVAV